MQILFPFHRFFVHIIAHGVISRRNILQIFNYHSAQRLWFLNLNFPPDLLHHVGLVLFPSVRSMILRRKLRTAPAYKVSWKIRDTI
jgi:hypothetical protein